MQHILTVSANPHIYQLCKVIMLTLFDMGFFELVIMGRGHDGPRHNFVVIAPIVINFVITKHMER